MPQSVQEKLIAPMTSTVQRLLDLDVRTPKDHSAAINARRGYLLQILGLIYQNGDEVFQQRPHQAVLLVGAGVSSRALTTISARV